MTRIPISKVYKKGRCPLAYQVIHDDGEVEFTNLVDKDGNSTVLPIDQFSGHPLMLNSNGFIMNDIMVFEEAQSDSVARAALSRLRTVNFGSLPEDMPVSQAMQRIVPANWSSPAEYIRLERGFGELYYSELQAQKAAKQAKEKTIEFDPGDNPNS